MKAKTGYHHLAERLGLRTLPHYVESWVHSKSGTDTVHEFGRTIRTFPTTYLKGDSFADHLDFALRHEGISLHALSAIFAAVPAEEVTRYVAARPTGKHTRRAWFLYEWLTGRRLPLADMTTQNYVDLLDPEDYITGVGRPVRRQRVTDNLLGHREFCPIVRRTTALNVAMSNDLPARAAELVRQYPADVLRRAASYLYDKETRSSFQIEHEKPSVSRADRFIAQLHRAQSQDFFTREELLELQRRIVDARYAATDYRTSQNYVGGGGSWERPRIHYVSPRPQDVRALMDALGRCHLRLAESDVHPVIHAAIIAYAFVFVHPFEDGNGRIHRFLIHNILSRRGFTPQGLIFPVSAVMVNKPTAYDASLEAFSKPVMELLDYDIDSLGVLTVLGETADLYRYPDMTAQSEALLTFVAETVETEFVNEIEFLVSYDRAKRLIQDVVDMPDRKVDLFIRLVVQNRQKLSQGKRESHFPELSDEEIARLEAAVREGYARPAPLEDGGK